MIGADNCADDSANGHLWTVLLAAAAFMITDFVEGLRIFGWYLQDSYR